MKFDHIVDKINNQNGFILTENDIFSIIKDDKYNFNIKVAFLNMFLKNAGYIIEDLAKDFNHFNKAVDKFKKLVEFNTSNDNFFDTYLKYMTNNLYDFVFVSMQKNEMALLLIWAIYYIKIFGIKRIIIYDNGSTDKETIRILKLLESFGIKVIYEFNTHQDFENKGQILLNQTKKIIGSIIDIIPLDVDEFLFVNENNSFIFNPETILNEVILSLKQLSNKKPILRINKSYFSIPGTYNIIKEPAYRTFLHKSYDLELDLGLHLWNFSKNEELYMKNVVVSEKLQYLHFHYRPYKEMIEKSKEKLRTRVDTNDIIALKNYHGAGMHLIKYLLMEKDDYDKFLFSMSENSQINIRKSWEEYNILFPFIDYKYEDKIMTQEFITNKNSYYKDKNIGDYTYGQPSLRYWNQQCCIGKFCSIASDVTIFGGGEHNTKFVTTYPFNSLPQYYPFAKKIAVKEYNKGPTKIGNDVCIGYGVTILSGITIGDGSVICAKSLVAKNVPPYAIVAGNPANIIRYRFNEYQIKNLLDIKWWDLDIKIIAKYIDLLLSEDIDLFIAVLKTYKYENNK